MSSYKVIVCFTDRKGLPKTQTHRIPNTHSVRTAVAIAIGAVSFKQVNRTVNENALIYVTREPDKLDANPGEFINCYGELRDNAAARATARANDIAAAKKDEGVE